MDKIQLTEDKVCSLFFICEEHGKAIELYENCKDPDKNKSGYCSKEIYIEHERRLGD